MESLTTIHHRLLDAGASTKQARALDEAVRELVVVCIAALRASHFNLWKQSAADTRLAAIDPTLTDEIPPTPNPGAGAE